MNGGRPQLGVPGLMGGGGPYARAPQGGGGAGLGQIGSAIGQQLGEGAWNRTAMSGNLTPQQKIKWLERKVKYEAVSKGKNPQEELTKLRGKIRELVTFTDTPGDLNMFIEQDKTLSAVQQDYIKATLAIQTPATPPSQMSPLGRGTALRGEMGFAEKALPRLGKMGPEGERRLGDVFGQGLQLQGWPEKWGGKTPPLTRPESPEALKSLQKMLFGGTPTIAGEAGLSMAQGKGPGEWMPSEASRKAMVGYGFEEVPDKDKAVMALLTMDRSGRNAVYAQYRTSSDELIDQYGALEVGGMISKQLGLGEGHVDTFDPEKQKQETFEERLVDYVQTVKNLPGLSTEALVYLGRSWLQEIWGGGDPWQDWTQNYWRQIAKQREYG